MFISFVKIKTLQLHKKIIHQLLVNRYIRKTLLNI